MNVMVPLPDKLAARFGEGAERERRVLEVLALDEYRAGRMDDAELEEVLGLSTAGDVDALLRKHGIDGKHPSASAEAGQPRHEAPAADLVALSRAVRAGNTLDGLDVCEMIREGRR